MSNASYAEKLHGLVFTTCPAADKGDDRWKYLVYATEKTPDGNTRVISVCTESPDEDTNGEFFNFLLQEIALTPGSIQLLKERLR